MRAKQKRLSAEQQLVLLQASALDYAVLAAAGTIPLFSQGMAIRKPNVGILFACIYATGLLVSFLLRRFVPPNKVFQQSGWILMGVGALIVINLPMMNGMLPDGGFDPRFYVPAFLCFFMALGSFVLWADSTMMFMTVPGVALFGILSWLDTSGFFEVSLILFMASIAVLLTRLHLRVMYAAARAAGFTDLHDLHRGPWRAVAGPFLAILTILVVAGCSWFVAPTLSNAARAAVGNQTITITPPALQGPLTIVISAEKPIGSGPSTSTNRVLFRVRADNLPPYIRTQAYDTYRRLGWNERVSTRRIEPKEIAPESQVANARVYEFTPSFPLVRGRIVNMLVRAEWGGSAYAPVPGAVVRFEHNGNVELDRGEFLRLPDGLPSGKDYFVRTEWPFPSIEMMREEPRLRGGLSNSIRNADLIDTRVRQLAIQLSQGKETPYDVIQACMEYIAEKCMYNLRAEAIRGNSDRVATFLFETNEGYCDLFASSLAVMLRAAGIDARVAVGFRVDASPDRDGWIPVRDRDAHMWTEVYFPRYGWIAFDVTDMARAVPGGEVGSLLDEEEENPTLAWAMKAATIIFGSAAVILIVAFIVGALRNRSRVQGPYRKLRPSYLAFLRVIAKQVKRPKMPSETTRQYAEAYRDATGNGELVTLMAEKFEEAFYSSDEPTTEQIEDVRKSVAELVASVKNGNGEK